MSQIKLNNVVPLSYASLLAADCEGLLVVSSSKDPCLFINERIVNTILQQNASEINKLREENKVLQEVVEKCKEI